MSSMMTYPPRPGLRAIKIDNESADKIRKLAPHVWEKLRPVPSFDTWTIKVKPNVLRGVQNPAAAIRSFLRDL